MVVVCPYFKAEKMRWQNGSNQSDPGPIMNPISFEPCPPLKFQTQCGKAIKFSALLSS